MIREPFSAWFLYTEINTKNRRCPLFFAHIGIVRVRALPEDFLLLYLYLVGVIPEHRLLIVSNPADPKKVMI